MKKSIFTPGFSSVVGSTRTPGQGPRLLLRRRRQQHTVIDTSALSDLTKPPKPLDRPVYPGGEHVCRTAGDVTRGLGLGPDDVRSLEGKLTEWSNEPNLITFRRSLYQALRKAAPANFLLRSEIARRAMAFYKATAGQRFSRRPGFEGQTVIQKSITDDDLAALRPRLMMRLSTNPMELVWLAEEVPDELHTRPEQHPPGWATESALDKALFRLDDIARRGKLVAAMMRLEGANISHQVGEDPLDPLTDEDREVLKSEGHKYLKRVPTGKERPKYRYIYKQPKTKGLTSSDDLQVGAKFKVEHSGRVGHFEVRAHDKAKGIVTLHHDESGQTAHIREQDLHRMITAHHKRKTDAAVTPLQLQVQATQPDLPGTKKPAAKPKPAAPALPRVTMGDMGAGGFDNIEGFSKDVATLEQQAAATKGDREFAVIPQAGGFVLASKPKAAAVGREAVGENTNIFMRGGEGGRGIQSSAAEFVLMEADDVVASHSPRSFAQRSDYPAGVQERRYHEIDAEQTKIDRIARGLEPALVVNSNPDAINGSPVVTEDGVVLGGNGRAMGMQRAYAMYPESGEKLKAYLGQHARAFGLSPAQVAGMKQPILVRRMQAGKDTDKLRKLGRRMNEALTQGLDPRSAEVALGKNYVNQGVVDSLTQHMEGDEPLGEFLRSGRSRPFVATIQRAGIVDEFNQAEFIDQKTGLLNEDGRMRVERVLAARLIPDATLLSQMGQALRQNLAKAAPSLLRAETSGWDIRGSLESAVRADVDMRTKGFKTSGTQRNEYLRQVEIGEAGGASTAVQKDKTAQALLTIIQEHNGARKMPAGFKQFALEADRQLHDHGSQGSMFARPKVSQAESLHTAFGTKPASTQTSLLAASMTAREALNAFAGETLVKAAVGDAGLERYISHAIGWELDNLLRGAIDQASVVGKPINGKAVLSKLKAFIVDQAQADRDFARALGAYPVTDAQLRALIQAHAKARVTDIAKSLAHTSLWQNFQKAGSYAG